MVVTTDPSAELMNCGVERVDIMNEDQEAIQFQMILFYMMTILFYLVDWVPSLKNENM